MNTNNSVSNFLRNVIPLVIVGMGLNAIGVSVGAESNDTLATRIAQSPILHEPLIWIGEKPPSEVESLELWRAAGIHREKKSTNIIDDLEAFVSTHRNCPWTPSLEANLGYYYRSIGRYTLALEHWTNAWAATQQYNSASSKQVADFTLANWSQLLASLGRMDELGGLVAATKELRMERPEWQRLWIQSQNALLTMKEHPSVSFRCGSVALMNVAEALSNAPPVVGALLQAKSPSTGFSMSALVRMAAQNHLNLVAVSRVSGDELVVPSVIHWKQNHYAAIVARQGNRYQVKDQTFGWPVWMSRDTINAEASGDFLVPIAQVPAGWRALSTDETDSIFGKGMNTSDPPPPPPLCPQDGQSECDCPAPPPPPPPGPPGPQPCSTCRNNGPPISASSGMPYWEVREPEISLLVHDQPMVYNASIGVFALKLDYDQRETRPVTAGVFSLGPDWNCNWLSYLDVTSGSGDTNFSDYSANLYGSRGGELVYSYYDTVSEYRTHTTLQRILDGSGNLTGFQQNYGDGSEAIYGLLVNVGGAPLESLAFMTKRLDAQGRPIERFIYSTSNNVVLLTAVVDFDGHTNTLKYNNATYPAQVTEVDNPFTNIVQLKYNGNGLLTNIVDVVGISSSFAYAYSNGVPVMINLTTPYGTNTFMYTEPTGPLHLCTGLDNINRAIQVTQPDGGVHLFMYRDDSSDLYRGGGYIPFLPYDYCPNVPSGPPIVGLTSSCSEDFGDCDDANFCYSAICNNPAVYDGICDHNMYFRNSFYWGPRQYALLSTTNITQLSTNDYKMARSRNWLHTNPNAPGAGLSVSETLTMQQDPSSDGVTAGQRTWYGYTGKTAYYHYEGTNTQPSWIARLLPDGTTQYTYREYNSFGKVTLNASTYTSGGSIALRTNIYYYGANGIDLLQVVGPDGITDGRYSYDSEHRMLAATNALSEVTRYTYNTNEELTGVTQPNGAVITNIYGTDGFLAQQVNLGIATNSYTYANGLILTHTDERGLTTTNSWDALQRLRRINYPDGTFVTNTYLNLDLVRVVDRMGFTNSYAYDSLRRMTNATDALGRKTTYNYCTCGTLDSIIDAAENITYFYRDGLGRATNTVYPGGYSVASRFNLIGQVTNTIDSFGASVTNWFDNQGLLYAVSNAFGRTTLLSIDIRDRVTNSVDENAVSINTTYDRLDRPLTRTFPDSGVERFGYTTNIAAVTVYTNQLGNVWTYAYDLGNRKTNEVGVGIYTNVFCYNGAGDLQALTEGNGYTNMWGYDQFGQLTNKVDAAGNVICVYSYDADNRLTNRWTPASSNTVYSYDAVGNLKTINYIHSTAINLSYDSMNRLTNMVDAIGTTIYTYDQAGQLLSEDGPWSDDVVGYTYTDRLRTSLNLQAPNASSWTQGYSYDAARRLTNITSQAGAFGYQLGGASAASSQIRKLFFPGGLYITNFYDGNARLLGTYLRNSSGVNLDKEDYVYNVGNQRTQQVFTAGNYMNYSYDGIGELKTAFGKEPGGVTNRLHEQFGYSYDPSRNLNYRTNNGFLNTFDVNSLNQLTHVGRSGTLTVNGTTTSPATNVTVNTSNAVLYVDNTFASTNWALAIGTNTFTAIAMDNYGRQDTNTVSPFLAINDNMDYDLNGNLLQDKSPAGGTNRVFAYDDENQMTAVWVTNAWLSTFTYDGKMRRRIRKEYTWTGSAWLQTNEVRYIYDGNLVIQERDGNNLPQVTYTRGRDLSGSLQWAGGIGGLLARTDMGMWIAGSGWAHALYHADGNGNIVALVYTNQTIAAKYEYDPYGNLQSQSGPLAAANLYRFSSKEYHTASTLTYYLYRYYDAGLQRWLNRDPISELGFIRLSRANGDTWNSFNPYSFLDNDPVDYVDSFGLQTVGGKGPSQAEIDKCNSACQAAGFYGGVVWGCIDFCFPHGIVTFCTCECKFKKPQPGGGHHGGGGHGGLW